MARSTDNSFSSMLLYLTDHAYYHYNIIMFTRNVFFTYGEILAKMSHKALEVNKIFNVRYEKAVFDCHVLNVVLHGVAHMRAKQTFLEAEGFTRPSFV